MLESTFFSFASFLIQTVQVSSEREVEKFFSFQLLNPKFSWIAEANSWRKVTRQHHKRSVDHAKMKLSQKARSWKVLGKARPATTFCEREKLKWKIFWVENGWVFFLLSPRECPSVKRLAKFSSQSQSFYQLCALMNWKHRSGSNLKLPISFIDLFDCVA